MSATANDLPEAIGCEEADATSIQNELPQESAEPVKNAAKLGLPNELNNRINRIDADLTELRADLARANKSVKTGLKQLDNQQIDLRTQTSEAYKRIGELDDAYRELTEKSGRINDEIQSVTTLLDALKTDTGAALNGLTEEHRALVAQVEDLAEKSRLAVQALNRGIRDNGKALEELKTHLRQEIDTLSRASREQSETLNTELNATKGRVAQAQEQINAAQARMLKMQEVDQALERRASTLETTAAQLRDQGGELSRSTKALQQLGDELGAAIEALRARAEEQARQLDTQAALLATQGEKIESQELRLDTHEEQLEVHAEQIETISAQLADHTLELEHHTGRIGELDQAHTKTRASLASLALREETHFRGLSIAAAAVLLIAAGIFYHHTQDQGRQTADLALSVDKVETKGAAAAAELVRLDQRANALETGVAVARRASEQGDQALRQEAANESQALRQELNSLNRQLVTLNDRVDGVSGRVANLRPGSAGLGDKTIHGPQWLAERPDDHYVVHLANADDKQGLYLVAERNGRFLKGELTYVPFKQGNDTRFALVQGSYATKDEAEAAKAALPRHLDRQQPRVYSLSAIRPFLGQ